MQKRERGSHIPVTVNARTGSACTVYILTAAAALMALCFVNEMSGQGPVERLWEFLWKFGMLCILMIISIHDIRERRIPNRCIAAGLLLWGCRVLSESIREGLQAGVPRGMEAIWQQGGQAILAGTAIALTCLLVRSVMNPIRKQTVLGSGDIKLLFLGGLIAGPDHAVWMMLITCVLGLVTAIIYKTCGQKQFPLGPAIAAAIACFISGSGGAAGL